MQPRNRIFDDMAHAAGNAFGLLSGAREEVETFIRQKIERALTDLDMVPRDEFEVVKTMAVNARAECAQMAERIAALEARIERLQGGVGATDLDDHA